MAKIVVEFDTLEKTCVVSQDGEVVGDLSSVCVFKNYSFASSGDMEEEPTFCIEVCQCSVDEANGTRKMTRLSASEHGLRPTREGSLFIGKQVLDYFHKGRR